MIHYRHGNRGPDGTVGDDICFRFLLCNQEIAQLMLHRVSWDLAWGINLEAGMNAGCCSERISFAASLGRKTINDMGRDILDQEYNQKNCSEGKGRFGFIYPLSAQNRCEDWRENGYIFSSKRYD